MPAVIPTRSPSAVKAYSRVAPGDEQNRLGFTLYGSALLSLFGIQFYKVYEGVNYATLIPAIDAHGLFRSWGISPARGRSIGGNE